MGTRVVAASGQLGTGFREESLRTALSEGADILGCDAGSTDAGPYYLGSGESLASPAAIRRDLALMMGAAVPRKIPLLIGSAGTGGGRPHLQRTVETVRDLAREQGLHLRLAVIEAELDTDDLIRWLRQRRIHPLDPAPPLTEDTLAESERVVAQMGAEPFMSALEGGADMVVAGRASDAAIFASVPLMQGCDAGAAWHAAKVVECGAAAVRQRLHPDCMVADIDGDGFVVHPPNEAMACTPHSVAAHSLYENADPHHIIEPSGVLDTSGCTYEAAGPREVRVRGSRFASKSRYDVRLEGVRHVGFRSIVVAGVRDPLVLRRLDGFLHEATTSVQDKAMRSLLLDAGTDYTLTTRVYGRDGCLGEREPCRDNVGHEVGVVVDVVAGTQESAGAVAALAWHTILHHPVPEWSGLVSNLAFPYSPPDIPAGPVYEFCCNHVLELDDPLAPFRVTMEEI